MTPVEWQKLERTVLGLSAPERDRLRTLLNRAPIAEPKGADPLLGLMADEADLMDDAVEAALAARERDPLRQANNAEDAA